MTVTGRKPGGTVLLVQGSTSFALSMSSARNEDGRRDAAALRDSVDEGEPIELTGERLPRAERPVEHRGADGDEVEREAVRLTPRVQSRSWPVRVEVESTEGKAAYRRVELQWVSSGDQRFVMTNEQQALSLLVALEITDGEATLSLSARPVRHDVHEARTAAAFALAVRARGAVVRVIRLDNGKTILELAPTESASEEELSRLRSWYAFTDELGFIQQRIARHGELSLDGDPTPTEVAKAGELFRLLAWGNVAREVDVSLTVEPSERATWSKGGPIHVRLDGGSDRLFGVDVPLGRVEQTILDRARFVEAVERAAIEASATGRAVEVELRELRVIEEYVDWAPGGRVWGALYEAVVSLSASFGRHDGYFLRADARAAGISDAVFDAALREAKIEAIAADVYHLVQFPRVDREELMILWLQTDRQGVLSHDTALSLHDLSDVLPPRSHVTVPPGWDPGERKLDAHVVLYHAEIGHDEIRWIGPVPYTSALRTLIDCIEVGVSPDLIEQAIAEGLGRGLFVESQIPASVWPKSA